jgi:hypothetical protein
MLVVEVGVGVAAMRKISGEGHQVGGIRDFHLHLLRTLSNFSRGLDSSLLSHPIFTLVSSLLVIILQHNLTVRGNQYGEQRSRPHNNRDPRPKGAAPTRRVMIKLRVVTIRTQRQRN